MTFTDRFKTRPASHSFFSAWEYNKRYRTPDTWEQDEWWTTYILNKRNPPNPAMIFGNVVGDTLGTPDSLVPDLVLPGVKEYELSAQLGDIYLVGYCDHYCPKTKVLHENKTSDNPTRWDQEKVDAHPQLDMYALMLYLRDKVKPEDITMYLNFIPVERGADMVYRVPTPPVYYQFSTRRTTRDILAYAAYVTNTVKEMEAYYEQRTAATNPPAS